MIGPESIFNHAGDCVCVVGFANSINNQSKLDTANARLIAAAPELLQACRDIASFSYTTCASNYGEQMALQEFVRIKRQARLAIARAEGRAE